MFPSFPLSTPLCSADTDQTSFSQTLPPVCPSYLSSHYYWKDARIPASKREREIDLRLPLPTSRAKKQKRAEKKADAVSCPGPTIGPRYERKQENDYPHRDKIQRFLGNRLEPIHGWNYGPLGPWKIREREGGSDRAVVISA